MKVSAVYQNYPRNKDVNFKAIWAYTRDAHLRKIAYHDTVNLTDKEIYSEHIPAIGEWIIKFVNDIQERNVDTKKALNYVPHFNEFPGLFLVTPEEKALFRKRIDCAEREIATSSQAGSMKNILYKNLEHPETHCGQLRKLIENLVLSASEF